MAQNLCSKTGGQYIRQLLAENEENEMGMSTQPYTSTNLNFST